MTERARGGRRGACERGSVSVEVAVIAPAFVFLMLLVVYAGKVAEADGSVERAASNAARAASMRQSARDATGDAVEMVEANLAAAGVQCRDLRTEVDTSSFRPGGTVTVAVSCDASMADVVLLGVPGEMTFRSRAVEVIDRFRSEAP